MHAHPVEGVEVQLEDGAPLVLREPVLPHQRVALGQEPISHLSVAVDVKEQLLDLVDAHTDANLPRMPTLVKLAGPAATLVRPLRGALSWRTRFTREAPMLSRLLTILTTLIVLTSVGQPAGPPTPSPSTRARPIRIIVGLAPGGGFDTYARVIARHMGKHIPGAPTLVVENMPGAGSLIAANHIYKVAKPDGLTVAKFNGPLMTRPGPRSAGNRVRRAEVRVHRRRRHGGRGLRADEGERRHERRRSGWPSETPVKLGSIAPGALAEEHRAES